MRPLLPHRIPGRPEVHYLRASGGLWLHDTHGFVALFGTRRDLARYLGVPAEAIR